MEENEKICRLCLKNCGINFKFIEEHVSEVLAFILKSNLFINKQAVMCANCEKSIKYCSEFKRKCLNVENSIVPLINCNDNDAKLKDENENGHNICRLCMGSTKVSSASMSLDCKLKEATPNKIMLNTCLPELDLHLTEGLIICVPCRKSLQHYFSFITNISIVEENIKKYREAAGMGATGLIKNVLEFTTTNSLGMIDTLKMEDKFSGGEFLDNQDCSDEQHPSENMSTNTGVGKVDGMGETFLDKLDCKIELKPEYLDKMEYQLLNDVPNFTIKCEEDDGHVDAIKMKHLYCQERVKEIEHEQENSKRLQDYDNSPQMNFNLPTMEPDMTLPEMFVKSEQIKSQPLKHVLTQKRKGNQSIRKNSSKMYQCEHCSYETKYKQNLKKHSLCHKSPSEITMYQCEQCSFQTKRKAGLKIHLMNHRKPSEISMYQCQHCTFQTKYEYSLTKHLLIHKSPSERTMYKCKHCSFQTKNKGTLKSHLLTHKNPSEIIMYQCEQCSFKTKRKGSVEKHLLSHKNPSEITMYHCAHCSYQTKYKYKLIQHFLVHKNPSEITMYQCEHCTFKTKYKYAVKKHSQTVHRLILRSNSEITMYQCEHCSFQTEYKKNLKTHLRTHKNSSK